MAVSDDVFRAILALDSYNRGYGFAIGDTTSGLSGTMIGNASIGQASASPGYSFYAQAYTWNGETVISYRGTDNSPLDLAYGWTTGGGSYRGAQAQLAAEFYKSVIGNTDPMNANVEFVGHSLGGGLAGMMASLYGKKAVVFDNMPFQLAALGAYEASMEDPWADIAAEILYPLNPLIGLLDPLNIYDPAVLAKYYFNGSNPQLPDWSQVSGYATSGEILAATRILGGQTIIPTTLDTGAPFGLISSDTLGPLQRHSQALLTILMFGNSDVADEDWRAIMGNISLALFNNTVAQAAGAASVPGRYSEANDFASVLQTVIAYSAIDEGTRVFGDTGIRSLFDDANELGKVIGLANLSKTLKDSANDLSKIITQFAGQLAIGKVLQAEHSAALGGVLSLSTDQQTLTVDFSDDLWTLGRESGGPPSQIVGRDALVNDVLSTLSTDAEGQPLGSDVKGGMKWLWNASDSSVFDRFVFATQNGSLTTTLTDRQIPSSKVTVLAASDASDTITGSNDNDFIYGGDGNDTIEGGVGDDLIAGGAQIVPVQDFLRRLETVSGDRRDL